MLRDIYFFEDRCPARFLRNSNSCACLLLKKITASTPSNPFFVHPNVTAAITKEVILLSRWEAAKLYEKELTKLIS